MNRTIELLDESAEEIVKMVLEELRDDLVNALNRASDTPDLIRDIITGSMFIHKDDKAYYENELLPAVKVVLKHYSVPGND